MSGLFSAITSYFSSSELTQLTFQDEKTSITIDVNFPLMKTLTSVFEDEKYRSIQKVEKVADHKEFFDYVHAKKTILTNRELCLFHRFAELYGMATIVTDLAAKINNLKFDDIIKVYDECKFNGFAQVFVDKFNKVIMYNISTLIYETYFKYIDINLIKMLVDRHDYEYEFQLRIEHILLNLVFSFFEKKYPIATITPEIRAEFLACINKIQFDTLFKTYSVASSFSYLIVLANREYYKGDTLIEKELATKFIVHLRDQNYETARPERNIAYAIILAKQKVDAEEKKCLTIDEVNKLNFGDVLDVKDVKKNWFVGSIINIIGDNIQIKYSGWGHSFSESIMKSEKRFAKLGAFTKGKIHDENNGKSVTIRPEIGPATTNDTSVVSTVVVSPDTTRLIKCDCDTCVFKENIKRLNALINAQSIEN
jgi:hypothetical protein